MSVHEAGGGDVENNEPTITPATGVSIGLIVTIIGCALWVVNGLTRLESRAARLEELVVDMRGTMAQASADIRKANSDLHDHESWSEAESVRLRMGLNEVRRKNGLAPLGEINPYMSGPRSNGRER